MLSHMTNTDPVGAIPPFQLTHRLARAREHAGMTQADLADALDISVRTVKRYEAGDHPKRGIVLGWALACGVNPTWLTTGNTGTDNGGNTIGYPALQAA